MTTLSLDNARTMSGAAMTGTDGSKIGKVSDVYVDNDTQAPEWALVHTGLFGGRESFVPLAQASMAGGGVSVPYTKEQVKDAPNAEPDGELSQEEEARLYAHYGLNYSESASDSGLPTAGGVAATGVTTGRTVGRDTSGLTTDDAMTRSEEPVRIGVQKRPSQTVRLRKHIVTENVTTTVPVTKERAVVTHEPITDANRAASLDGPEITEAVHEISLHEQRAVVEKETVPVERIRLDKDTVTTNETVSADVRKEQIEVIDDGVDGTTGLNTRRDTRR